ncbi:MAG: hypothetical protein ABH883_07145 [Candidatus Omnitrophota bacterium]
MSIFTKMEKKTKIELAVFFATLLLLTAGTIVLVILDISKANRKDLNKLQHYYRDILMKEQAKQSQGPEIDDMTLDEALNSLPKVDRIDPDEKNK